MTVTVVLDTKNYFNLYEVKRSMKAYVQYVEAEIRDRDSGDQKNSWTRMPSYLISYRLYCTVLQYCTALHCNTYYWNSTTAVKLYRFLPIHFFVLEPLPAKNNHSIPIV